MTILLKFHSWRTRFAMILLAPIVAAVVIVLGASTAAQAATPPAGSYRQSCNEVKASSRVLKARCQMRNGAFLRTSLAGYRACAGDIANQNGRLVCRERRDDIVLYEGSYFRGRSVALDANASSLPRWFNDRASSIRVRHGDWQICTDANYRGRCQTVRRDVDNLNRIGLNDRVSSLRRVSDGYPGGGGYQPPQGSYQQSCRNVTFDGRLLNAACSDRQGRYRASQLDVRTCDDGDDIRNRDGELTCQDRRGGGYGNDDNGNDNTDNGAPLPGGSYQQTCRNMMLSRATLRGECRTSAGEWRDTTLDLRTCSQAGDIGNNNGALTCVSGGPSPPASLPSGSYQRSCRNITNERGVLRAECQDSRGVWNETMIDMRVCRGAPDIANDNGILRCVAP